MAICNVKKAFRFSMKIPQHQWRCFTFLMIYVLKIFHATDLFLYPMKTSEKTEILMFSREYKKTSGIKYVNVEKHFRIFLVSYFLYQHIFITSFSWCTAFSNYTEDVLFKLMLALSLKGLKIFGWFPLRYLRFIS